MRDIVSILKNLKKTYLLVFSDEPLLVNNEWCVIMQQEFNGNYLTLIKKVGRMLVVVVVFNNNIERSLRNDQVAFLDCGETNGRLASGKYREPPKRPRRNQNCAGRM